MDVNKLMNLERELEQGGYDMKKALWLPYIHDGELTPAQAIEDLDDQIDFVMRVILERKDKKRYVPALLKVLQDASKDLVDHHL